MLLGVSVSIFLRECANWPAAAARCGCAGQTAGVELTSRIDRWWGDRGTAYMPPPELGEAGVAGTAGVVDEPPAVPSSLGADMLSSAPELPVEPE